VERLPVCTAQTIGEAIPAAAFAVDDACRLFLFNKSAAELFGLDRQQVLGRRLEEVLGETAWLNPVATEGVRLLGREIALPWRQQTIRAIVDATPLVADNGRPCGALAVIKDAVSLRETERRFQQLEILAGIGELAAGTVHEIRNPLTSISGFVQLLRARAARQSDQTSVDYCSLITEEINHINSILSDFLTLAKPQEVRFSRVNIVQLVQDLLNLLYGEAILSQIAIVTQLPAGPLWVRGNSEKIKEVLINICRNAFQAMDAGGTLTVAAEADSDTVRIAVTDDGHGVPEAISGQIFKPFFTTKEDGTGLGLAICQRIMRDHGGEILVSSAAGKGSTFTLTFPRLQDL
jgi:two-component system, sporulation sensor kinase E